MASDVLDVDTSRRRIVDLTDAVRSFCGDRGDPRRTVRLSFING